MKPSLKKNWKNLLTKFRRVHKMDLNKYGALLHSVWKPKEAPDRIGGCWAEDFSPFEITVPHQLRDLLVDLQNDLSKEYNKKDDNNAVV